MIRLHSLASHSIIVADTGDLDAVERLRPTDCTTNPSLVLKAFDLPRHAPTVEEAIVWGRRPGGTIETRASAVADRLAVAFGAAAADLVPGRVSTEVDADLSFDTDATVARARAIVAAYAGRGIPREKVLVKIAATWEGIQACAVLQREGIDCNMTLVFGLAQAQACAEAGAFLISPFVGRIRDWYAKAEDREYGPEEDPGVLSVRRIFAFYKSRGIATVVMGASFRTTGQVEALAGCDRLTVSPSLLDDLARCEGDVPRRLDPADPGPSPDPIPPGEAAFRFALNEDAMATEKLAEGIRLFARDLRTLKATIARRLDD
jgi:transaldolase